MAVWTRGLIAVYCGFLVYGTLVFFLGGSGVLAQRRLEEHNKALETNIESLEQISEILERKRSSLLRDPEEIKLLSRALGLYQNNEIRIVVPGSRAVGLSQTLGRVVGGYKPDGFRFALFRLIAVITSCLVFAVLSILRIGFYGSRKKTN